MRIEDVDDAGEAARHAVLVARQGCFRLRITPIGETGNLDRRLSGASPGDTTAVELNGMALAFGLLRARLASWVGRFLSNKGGAT